MKKLYISILLSLSFLPFSVSNATTWTITSVGNTFSPATITITIGDTVVFSLTSLHDAMEVTQATWNANGSTGNGGFQIPFGGGTLIPNQVKTYYYICENHISMGMKGQIIVNPSTGIPTVNSEERVLKFLPNPAATQTQIHTGISDGKSNKLVVFDIAGKVVHTQENILNNHLLDVMLFKNGIYFVEFKSEGYRRTSKLVISHK